MVGNLLLALVIGALLPIIAVLQVSLLVPLLMLGGIFAVRMRARVGYVPPMVLFGAALSSTLWLMGTPMMFMLLAAGVLPALVVMGLMAQKRPFFQQMRVGIAAHGIGLVAALLIARLSFGSGMVAQFTDVLRGEFARMPDSTLQPFVEAMNSALALSGVQGVSYTVEMYRSQLSGVLDLMQQTYAQALPGVLLSGALLSGVICVLWGNWTMARLGLATNESFVGMSGWFLPAQVSYGALALWAAGILLMMAGYAGGATVYAAVCAIAGPVFILQALSAADRRMLRAGAPLSRRRVLITLLAVAALLLDSMAVALAGIGAASALFGSHGAIKRNTGGDNDDQSDRDDPQE